MKNCKLIMMIGLPGSGKSTYTKELLKQNSNLVRICRDDFKTMISYCYGDYKFNDLNESMITDFVKKSILIAFEHGKDVIIDECSIKKNTRLQFINDIKRLSPYINITTFGIFVNTPIETCKIRRSVETKDAPKTDWNAVITNMWNKFEIPTKFEFNEFLEIKNSEV